MLILCCKAYQFNETVVNNCYSNPMILGMWRAVSKTSIEFSSASGPSARLFTDLVGGRSCAHFEINHMQVISKSNLRATVSTATSIKERNIRIAPVVIGHLTEPLEPMFQVLNTRIFWCQSDMIMRLCNVKPGSLFKYTRDQTCICANKTECIDLETMQNLSMCLKHGASGSPRLIKFKIGNVDIVARGCQCTHPSIYFDKSVVLPRLIEEQMDSLLAHFGYRRLKFMEVTSSEINLRTWKSESSEQIMEMRQCICLGATTLGVYTVAIWMIRPTLNYMECVIKCSDTTHVIEARSAAMLELSKLGRNNEHRLSLRFEEKPRQNYIDLHVSGDALPYIINSGSLVSLGTKISMASIGSSVLNMTAVELLEESPRIIPMVIDIGVVKSISSGSQFQSGSMCIVPEMKKVRIKFFTTRVGTSQGPSLTLGSNGGFQWMGNPSALASTLAQFFCHVAARMQTREFRDAVSRASTGTRPKYPSCVPRSQK
jgi:hypothetical protein